MTKLELIDLIANGRDIMFDVAGKHYTILTWCEEGIGIDQQYPNDFQMSYYPDATALVENFKVNSVPLGELAAGIRITEYS